MHVTTWGHSCVRVEVDDTVVVVDPGTFSDLPGALVGADHVLVTHEHADHLAVPDILTAVSETPGLVVHGPAAALALLADAGAPEDRLRALAPGDRFALGSLPVVVGGGRHAEVHPDVPRPVNLGYLIGPVWHPGDCLDLPPGPARVLLVPIGGPWLRLAAAIELVRAVRPELAVPIHDAMYSGPGRVAPDALLARLGGAGEYRRLEPGEMLTV